MEIDGKTGFHHGMLNVVMLPAVLCFNKVAETVMRDNRYTRIRHVMNLPAGADFTQVVYNLTTRLGLPTDLHRMGVSEGALEHIMKGALLDYCRKTNLRIVAVDDYHHMLAELI